MRLLGRPADLHTWLSVFPDGCNYDALSDLAGASLLRWQLLWPTDGPAAGLRQGPLPVPEPMPRHVAAAILAELQPLCVVAAKLPLLALAGAMPLAYAFQEVFLELLALASYGLRCIATSVGSEPGDGSDTSR